MEQIRSKEIEKTAVNVLAVIALNLGGCTPSSPEKQADTPAGPPIPISKVVPKLIPEILITPSFSEKEFREKIERSWIMGEARALTHAELAQEGLKPEELPNILQELTYSFDSYATGTSTEPVMSFQGTFFEGGVKMRFKRGDLPELKKDQALARINAGILRGVEGASISSSVVTDDTAANIFCTFIASPSTLPKSSVFMRDGEDLTGFSIPLVEDHYQNEHGMFSLITQSVITFRPTITEAAASAIKNTSKIPEAIKPRLLDEFFLFSLFAAGDHEVIGHPAAYPSKISLDSDNHSQKEQSFMSTRGAAVTVVQISPDTVIPSTESFIVEEGGIQIGAFLKRNEPKNDIAYKTIRLKRILYNKFILNKPKSKLQSSGHPDFINVWNSIPE